MSSTATQRKLGQAQREVLEQIQRYRGLGKEHFLSPDWHRIDRLHDLGFLEVRFMMGTGDEYFITDAGRDALAEPQ